MGGNAFDEDQVFQSVMQRINTAQSAFRQLDANPNDVNRFYSQHVRGITLAIAPLKQNNPTVYGQIVDDYTRAATQIDNDLVDPTIAKPRIAAKIKLAITSLYVALDAAQ